MVAGCGAPEEPPPDAELLAPSLAAALALADAYERAGGRIGRALAARERAHAERLRGRGRAAERRGASAAAGEPLEAALALEQAALRAHVHAVGLVRARDARALAGRADGRRRPPRARGARAARPRREPERLPGRPRCLSRSPAARRSRPALTGAAALALGPAPAAARGPRRGRRAGRARPHRGGCGLRLPHRRARRPRRRARGAGGRARAGRSPCTSRRSGCRSPERVTGDRDGPAATARRSSRRPPARAACGRRSSGSRTLIDGCAARLAALEEPNVIRTVATDHGGPCAAPGGAAPPRRPGPALIRGVIRKAMMVRSPLCIGAPRRYSQ